MRRKTFLGASLVCMLIVVLALVGFAFASQWQTSYAENQSLMVYNDPAPAQMPETIAMPAILHNTVDAGYAISDSWFDRFDIATDAFMGNASAVAQDNLVLMGNTVNPYIYDAYAPVISTAANISPPNTFMNPLYGALDAPVPATTTMLATLIINMADFC